MSSKSDTPVGRLREALSKKRGPGAAGITFEAVVKNDDLRAVLEEVKEDLKSFEFMKVCIVCAHCAGEAEVRFQRLRALGVEDD